MKRCTWCCMEKPLEAFTVSKGKVLQGCRQCRNSAMRDRYAKEIEKNLERAAAYRAAHPNRLTKEQMRMQSARFRERRPDKAAEYSRRYNASEKGRVSAAARAKRRIETISDCYLRQSKFGLQHAPPEILELKRMHLRLVRLVKEKLK